MSRLGLIGGTDSKRTSGVYQPEDVVALQDAKNYVSRFGYDGVFNALTSSGIEEGFDVSRDGRYVYVAVRGTRTTAAIFQYECSTPWDLSTIAYSSKSLVVGDWDISCNGIAISDDGTRLFFSTRIGGIWSCTLSTPFDLATATVDVRKVWVGGQDTTPNTPVFGDSGTKMYIMGASNDRVYQYNLTTAWDVSTATYSNNSFLVTSQDATPQGIFFKDDGLTFYMVGSSTDTVYQYTLSTAWDISTASYASKSFSVAGQETAPRALFFKSDGLKMYVTGTTGDDVNEYDLGTAWDVSTASFVRVSAAVGEATPTGLWFKDDGTKMYVIGQSTDTVREFTLSTAWNVSTISFSKSLSIASLDGSSTGVTFRDDGTEIYVLGQASDVVYEIQLGTAWDTGTAKGFIYVGDLQPSLRGIHINDDGTLLFLTGSSDNVHKCTLSTPYEIASATLSQNFAVVGTMGVHVTADGLRIYVTTDDSTNPPGGRQVRQITLTSPNDLSTATLSTVELSPLYGLTGASGSPWGIRVSPDGTRMFVLSDVIQGMYQFSLRFA